MFLCFFFTFFKSPSTSLVWENTAGFLCCENPEMLYGPHPTFHHYEAEKLMTELFWDELIL